MKHTKVFLPIIVCVSIVVGIVIGMTYSPYLAGRGITLIGNGHNKFDQLLQIVSENYVDTIYTDSLVEQAMPQIVSELDPHSRYISSDDAQEAAEDLQGAFTGIGVTFMIHRDTVNVMSLIHGGPAEKVGLLPGDRIVTADSTLLVGMSDERVIRQLKGLAGTTVRVGVRRAGVDTLRHFSIQRDFVTTSSVESCYMMDESTAYMYVSKFAENTYRDMLSSLAVMATQGMRHLVLDLRGNTGGYLEIAIQMANEFLDEDQLIVYTQGCHNPREDYYSNGKGSFQWLPLVVLVDEGSASASEVFAGAIQDNDRGTIVGRRTFGKGLVQQPVTFDDGSVVRLTVARYFTPSGRCIQKPYEQGHAEEYELDLTTRYERGEFFSPDSIHLGGPEYRTSKGRTVYGGGGIMPDEFVAQDTTLYTSYYKEAVTSGLIRQFAFEFADSHRPQLAKYQQLADVLKYLHSQNLPEQFARYADKNGLRRRNLLLQKSRPLMERGLNAQIVYHAKEIEDYHRCLNQNDPMVMRALQLFAQGKSYPMWTGVNE